MSTKPENNFTVTNMTKGKLHRLPFLSMKESVLGKTYDLSLVFASREMLWKLNRTYRSKDETTDILSFPLDKTRGEIFINLEETRKESKKFGRDFENFLAFLFIHGLVHLKGFRHGSRMEALEKKFRRKFGI
ncbi:MAG: rRNA maturation RNase YbeY [bacterium]|nr:rRNA maturation RNase YbeY [bacterium]